jgi:hypothetical protein
MISNNILFWGVQGWVNVLKIMPNNEFGVDAIVEVSKLIKLMIPKLMNPKHMIPKITH